LFWTLPLASPVETNLSAGRAHMSARHLTVTDFHDIPNALFRFENPVSSDASCSVDIHWSGPITSSAPVTTPGSSGTLFLNKATLTWSARNATGFRFESNPSPTTSAFAQLGRIRNGIFNESDDD
jgi:hypothetical protein